MYLLIVTGMSGAGKSTALNALEEMGYYCVDNLPSPMLPAFVEMCNKADVPIERAAVAVDSRESLLSAKPDDALDVLRALSCRYEILFPGCAWSGRIWGTCWPMRTTWWTPPTWRPATSPR